MKTFEKYFNFIITGLIVLLFFRTCGMASDVNKIRKEVETNTVSEKKMIQIIKETPNWKTLEIEELSDKNKVPINYFKNSEEKDTVSQ